MQATSVSIGTLSERLHDLTAWFWAVSDVGSSLKSLKLGDFSHRLGPSGACERSCDLGGTSASFEWWLEGWHRVAGAMQKIIQGCVLHATILNIHIYIYKYIILWFWCKHSFTWILFFQVKTLLQKGTYALAKRFLMSPCWVCWGTSRQLYACVCNLRVSTRASDFVEICRDFGVPRCTKIVSWDFTPDFSFQGIVLITKASFCFSKVLGGGWNLQSDETS